MPVRYESLATCRACPRLVSHLDSVRQEHPGYHCRPVPAWGSARSRVLVVGLAPGLHGANRTGQPFTGDASGSFLFAALTRHGFATDVEPARARLRNLRITNAVKCLPPENRPVAAELAACSHFLRHEIFQLWTPKARKPRCVLCLGHLAHQAVARAISVAVPDFRHGQLAQIDHNLWLADTYHPSRQNTNTGRLTEGMLDAVIGCVAGLVDA